MGDPKSVQTKPFDLTEFLGEGWKVWKGPADGDGLSGEEDVDERSLDLTENELTSLPFETCPEEDQTGVELVDGEEKLRRLKKKPEFIRFGGNVFMILWLDYQADKENSILEFLYRTQHIFSLDFFGLILRSPDGKRHVLFLYRYHGKEWSWSYEWLEHDCNPGYSSGVLVS